ncbi:MAG: gluconate 2-dehydrogenase subunit 3 family protein [Pseudomonadota bacterium]
MSQRTHRPKPAPDDSAGIESAGRREFLSRLGGVLGASALASLLHGLPAALAYTPRTSTLDSDGAVFNLEQLRLLHDLCARTLPATDTPGAAELDVHGFIDVQLATCYAPSDQARARKVIDVLEAKGFSSQGPSGQVTLLEAMEAGRFAGDGATREDFKFLKSLVVFGYFTTEVGATRLLRYDPVPGGFDGHYGHPADGRAWFA